MNLPNHIAIIMDGNGRWGKKKYNNRLLGHEKGIKNIKKIIEYCLSKEISNLTIYALSKDNLVKRNKYEINNIFGLLKKYLETNIEYFKKNKVKINFIGELNLLPSSLRKILLLSEKKLRFLKKKLTLNVAINYSSKIEILNAMKKILKYKKKINIKNLESYLFTKVSGHPEIIIRTGGFKRLSDFLLWQAAYSELFFVTKFWPDFKVKDLENILIKFNKIKRNFGK
ncbi:MAG: di-trans,poly-cis-decaprenylcistransferase [Candidatus Pelagibacter sp.]|mgnify:CR=1 FL=1|nr:di-trans,poly-cis-decaprenylcistransferase [Candidatus Pelagibacter sp.]OUV87301.1 MAG: di-trans,poly-cis-decaprenylcistransferase [Pelagibacteraceae bacterium TMED136]|tara:strand:+ start:36580 stop:37260 length:681 start_codon:yes stop_codon:yes gene_type:complete